jgi:hypothetical protein
MKLATSASTAYGLQLRIALDQLVALHERRQVRLVRDVEEDGQHADDEGDGEELQDVERAERVRDRDRSEGERASHVADDQDRPSREPVDPDTGREGEQQERQLLEDGQRRDGEGARMEDVDRRQRQREQRELRAELADRLPGPELEEVPVAPEPTRRPEPRAL